MRNFIIFQAFLVFSICTYHFRAHLAKQYPTLSTYASESEPNFGLDENAQYSRS